MKSIKNKLQSTVQNHLGELYNVSWPTRQQATHIVIAVLIVVAIVGIFLTFADYVINIFVQFLLSR